jgi:hypothetical protein
MMGEINSVKENVIFVRYLLETVDSLENKQTGKPRVALKLLWSSQNSRPTSQAEN